MNSIEALLITFGDLAWGPWLLILLLGGGLYFIFLSRFLPFLYLPHSLALLSGKYDKEGPGDFQALSSALAGTIGMGNIAGCRRRYYSRRSRRGLLDVDYSNSWYYHEIFHLHVKCHVSGKRQ